MRKIAVISDPQLNLQGATFKKDYCLLCKCFQNMDVDCVIVCGDITENADEEEWNLFFKAFRQNSQAENLFLVPGNMDNLESETGRLVFENAFMSQFGNCPETIYIVHETDSYILFGIAVERDDDDSLTDLQLTQLDESLRSAAAHGIPTLVFGHYLLNDTLDTDWEYAELGPQSYTVRNLFEKYGGTVVYFSGHLHRGLMNELGGTVTQINGVTYVSTPSICHPDKEHYNADNDDTGTGFLVELNGSALRIRGFDYANGKYLIDFNWNLNAL